MLVAVAAAAALAWQHLPPAVAIRGAAVTSIDGATHARVAMCDDGVDVAMGDLDTQLDDAIGLAQRGGRASVLIEGTRSRLSNLKTAVKTQVAETRAAAVWAEQKGKLAKA
eukprot:5089040-Prymnesium_polylepis.1